MQTFVAIGQAETLTQAAATIRHSLSSVSRTLKRIETAAQLILVRRDAEGLELTGAGRDYLSACQQILEAQRSAAEVFARHQGQPEGILRLGSPLPFVRHVLCRVLPAFQEQYPKLKVDIALYCSDWDQAPKAAHDLFFKVRTPKDSRHHLTVFPAIRQGLFASPTYLRGKALPERPLDLAQHASLGQTRDHSAFAWELARDGHHVAVTPEYSVVVPDVEVLTQFAIDSAGVAVLPLWLAHPHVASGKLVPVLEHWTPEPVRFCAMHSGRIRMASREAALLKFLSGILGTERDPRCAGSDPSLFFQRL